jgi:choline-sulfatase
MESRTPNILLIMTDQQRPDEFGCLGTIVETPNLDKLISESVRFSRAYCQAPVCLPSRSSFVSNRYVRDHGISSNNSGDLPRHLPTFPQMLRQAGYHTALIGKADIYRDRTVKHARDTAYRMREYGFDEPIETGGQQQTCQVRSEYTDWLESQSKQFYDLVCDWSRKYNYRTRTIPMWHAEPHPLPAELYLDSWIGRRSARWIEEYNADKPWFLWASFTGPHDPWDPPEEFFERYRDKQIPARNPNLPDLSAGGPFAEYIQGRYAGEGRLGDSSKVADEVYREVRRHYYAKMTLIDGEIGRILTALEKTGGFDNTWVIFTSDHGEMLGDHGFIGKMVFYEPSVRVPLVIRPPKGMSGRVEPGLVEQVDLAATMTAVAGAPDVADGEGRPLAGHFAGSKGFKRKTAISQNLGFAMFTTERHKLVVHEETLTPYQLFDLTDDPQENRNLVNDAAAAKIRDELMKDQVRPFFDPRART